MELATIFLIWLVVTIIDNLASRKKRRLPPDNSSGNPSETQPDNSPNFDIPTLANDPNRPGEEIPIFIELPQQAEVRPLRPATPPQKTPPKSAAQVVRSSEASQADELELNLTPSTVMNAFVLSEILGRPKALRRH